MNFDETGTLTIRVYTAGGALPIRGSTVKISGADEENRFFESRLVTDEDGATAKIVLPSPKKSYSLAPRPPETPYAAYDLVISAPGYYTKHIYGISVFSGVDSIQPIAMIPLTNGDTPIPRDNLDIFITSNERLD